MNIASTKERIIQYIDYKGINKQTFFEKTGLKRGFLDADKIKSTVTDVFLSKIIATFPEINIKWLITGDGHMITNEIKYKDSDNDIRSTGESKSEYKAVPLYNLEAYTGLKPFFENGSKISIDSIVIPGIPKCDGAVRIAGDSMYPLLKSGDIVLYKKINDIKGNIFLGEMYLVSIEMDGEEYIVVTYINKSSIPDHIKLVSHNPSHDDKDVHISKVMALAFVKASIRINSMN